MREQSLGMSGIIDESTAANAGRILGLKAVVLGRLIDVQKIDGDIKTTPMEVFELYQGTNNKGKTKVKGKKVTIYLIEGSSKVEYKAQYQIIDTETGRILSSDIETASDKDYVKYFKPYRGVINNLTIYDPGLGTWGVAIGKYAVGDVDKSLFSARNKLKSPQEMSGQIIENLASQISRRIIGYFD